MFNSYYANINPSKNVTVNTPSSIAGTLVKSHTDSVITCIKVGSSEFNELFGIDRQIVSYETTTYHESSSFGRGYSSKNKHEFNVEVLQVMLANNDMVFVEYVIKEE